VAEPLLRVRELSKHFPIRKGLFTRTVGHVRAVDGVSFDLFRGETLGLVGESGCGKTTTGRCILRLLEPTAGSVQFEGRDVLPMAAAELRALRRQMQIVFQDPYSSLNPRLTIGSMLAEPLAIHKLAKGAAARDRVAELLTLVGMSPDHARRYPHEFSGGQRQRIGIARALAVSPKLLVLDEPVSALDVSIQAQIVNLLRTCSESWSHVPVRGTRPVRGGAHQHARGRDALGRIVELADAATLYRDPRHPYTRSLLSAVPADPDRRSQRIVLKGDVPSPGPSPSGCRFHPRCPLAAERRMSFALSADDPILREVAPGRWPATSPEPRSSFLRSGGHESTAERSRTCLSRS
jgi:oligopeptide/dipeptide ABC transporter ATP-binding protein